MHNFSKIFFWCFFNVLLALFPLVVNFIIINLIPHSKRIDWKWINLLKEGELFVFSSTLSATAIGDMFLKTNDVDQLSLDLIVFIVIPLFFVLLASSIIFGCSALIKIQKEFSFSPQSLSVFEPSRFAYGSVACAIMAIGLSGIAFILKGA